MECPWCGSQDVSLNSVEGNPRGCENQVLKDYDCNDCGCSFTAIEDTTITIQIDEEGDADKKDLFR